MKRRFLCIAITAAVSLLCAGLPSQATEEEEPPLAPPSISGGETPAIPVHSPPELPDRQPLPPPPAVATLPPSGDGSIKPPLAWRAVAHRLWQFPEGKLPPCCKSQFTLKGNFGQAQKALAGALGSLGFSILSSSPTSGHLLAARDGQTPGSNIRLVFALREAVPGETTVRAGSDPERMRLDQKLFGELESAALDRLKPGDRL